MRKFLVIFILISLSGCFADRGNPENPASPTNTFSSSSQTGTEPQDGGQKEKNDTLAPIPEHMSATDCRGPSTVFYGPTMVFSESMPSGWEESDDEPATEVFLRLFECQKISWGPFERGPVTMLAEVHGSLDATEGCLGGHPYDAVSHTWLSTLWFSDRELADWVKTTYGAPVHYGEFQIVQDATPATITYTWSWQVPDQEQSYITMRDVVINDEQPSTYVETWFWFNGQGISYMDASSVAMADETSAPFLDGHLAPPMMFATASGQGNYAAIAGWYPSGDFDAPIRRFGDLECASPL